MNIIQSEIFKIILISSLFYIFDKVWFKTPIAKETYNTTVKMVQGFEIDSNNKIIYAVIAYLIMGLGYYYLIYPNLDSNWKLKSIMFSLLVWGVFNTTNMVIFKNYTQKMVIIDTLWGIFATQLVGFSLKYIDNKIIPFIFRIY